MVSHHHKCIFVHIPKTGGMSIEKAFLESLGLRLHRGQNHSLVLSYNRDPLQGPPSLAHLTAGEYCAKSYVSPEIFETYFKFSFVRNPWSRMVSIYKHFDYHRYLTFERFIDYELLKLQEKRAYFVMPQVKYIFDKEGKKLIDFIGRFENMEEHFDQVRKCVSQPLNDLDHINRSPKSHNWYSRWNLKFVSKQLWKSPGIISNISLKTHCYSSFRDYYSSKTRSQVEEIYQEDIESFNYRF